MDLSLDWTPSSNGNALAPYAALQKLEDDAILPNLSVETEWASKNVRAALSDVPESREAICRSVVMLWRLKSMEAKLQGAGAAVLIPWQQYMTAWRVSSRCVIG